jgi:cell division protein FtsQ
VEASRKRRIRAIVAIVSAAGVIFGVVAVYRSQLFEIDQVDVAGAQQLSAQDVVRRAGVPDGATLLRYPAEEIEARLLEDPWIASATVSRDFPSTLRIRIQERVPLALVDAGPSFWVVDETGLVLAEASLEESSPLVVIRDVPAFEPQPGRTSNSDALVNALEVLKVISPELRDLVRAVSAPSVDEATLITVTSVEVLVGEATQLQEKSALVLGILKEQAERVVFIDVRSIDRPVSRGLGE